MRGAGEDRRPRVHLDHNATTPLRPEARAALFDAYDRLGGNPSSIHASGRAARAMLDDARERIAAALGVQEDEVVFNSGGTESNHLALLGTITESADRLVTTTVEHSAVLAPAERLEKAGHAVTRIGVDAEGRLDVETLVRAAEGARLVSVMAANNEVGSVYDLGRIVAALEESYGAQRPTVHSDAVQALGKLPLALSESGVDLASFSGHKVGAPVGVGFLFRRHGTALCPIFEGGGQESDLRAGTENVAGIHSMAVAVQLAVEEQESFAIRSRQHVERLWKGVGARVPALRVLGPSIDAEERLPNTLNLHVPGADGRMLVTRFDLDGLELSAGSACSSGSLQPSHVLRALGHDDDVARAGLRISVGRTTDEAEIAQAVETLSITLGKAS